ncbi:class I SAM-dependent methyltransferase [bacterium]|nr:class I SAM-dependent methyltransferase [bacterium]
METVRAHFEQEAPVYDGTILKLIPGYRQMISAVVDALPFGPQDEFSLVDLGCGTGSLTRAILSRFPEARVTALDFSAAMIGEARENLKNERIRFVHRDFSKWTWDQPYDAVVSSLALHHLITDEDKKHFYAQCFRHLKPGGMFCNADIVLANTDMLQKAFMGKWKSFMMQSVDADEIEGQWMVKYRTEDVPARMDDHLIWLKEAGFKYLDIIWKYYNFAVYCALKT